MYVKLTSRWMYHTIVILLSVSLLFLLLLQTLIQVRGAIGISNSSLEMETNIGDNLVKHIIVIIQGEHSFDNYFGTFPYVDGFPERLAIPANPLSNDNSSLIKPFHLETTKYFKPNDAPSGYRLSYNNGSMNGFVYASRNVPNNAENVMGFYDNRDIPYYWKFASEYVLAQRFFSPSMRSDLVNSLYAIGDDPSSYLNLSQIPQKGLEINKTIFDELESKSIPWKVYIENYSGISNMSKNERMRLLNNIPILAVNRFMANQSLQSHFEDLPSFIQDIRNKNLPKVSYLYFTKSNDGPTTRVQAAQTLISTLVYSVMKSNYWNDSAIIITHSESGGWFDHVRPPINKHTKELYGFRVPAIFISPYAKDGYIDNNTYDMASVLKFIESSFGIQSGLKITKNTSNIVDAFDFTRTPRQSLYLEEISRESSLIRTNNKASVNSVYAVGLLIPAIISIIWYFKNSKTA